MALFGSIGQNRGNFGCIICCYGDCL